MMRTGGRVPHDGFQGWCRNPSESYRNSAVRRYVSVLTQPLSDASDDATFQTILATRSPPQGVVSESVSARIVSSHKLLVKLLKDDLKADPFKRLGKWSEFLTNRLYFAMFVHPSPDAAYQVYEVVNTRGRDLTTADLLKNYMLSQAGQNQTARYEQWQAIAKEFADDGANNFVQYIRHVVTVKCGYVLPKDLFGFLAGRKTMSDRAPPAPGQLMDLLQGYLPLYAQMIDPTASGPTEGDALGVFSALNSLGVLTVRPILLACADVPDGLAGMKWILRLVVRRIVVGNLGTGNVERRLGEAARVIAERRDWTVMIDLLQDLSPSEDDFVRQLGKRKFNKQVLTFLRRSIIQKSITPDPDGVLHFIWTSNSPFGGMSEAEALLWAPAIGNTLMSHIEKRPKMPRPGRSSGPLC